MCGIAGFCSIGGHFKEPSNAFYSTEILRSMNQCQKHRGPDGSGIFLSQECGFAHVRLAIQDIKGGKQPMEKIYAGRHAVITYNGEIYNAPKLRRQLKSLGMQFETSCDTEVLINGYLYYGMEFIKQCNGIFAFALYDFENHSLFLCRDPMGVKPLYYTWSNKQLIFASEPKGIFSHPDRKPKANLASFQEIFALGPAQLPYSGVFQDIYQVLPGTYLCLNDKGISQFTYWKLENQPFHDTTNEALEKVGTLVKEAIKDQLLSDVEICTFLSGGLDSSLVTSISASEAEKSQGRLKTYSFDFEGNDTYFLTNDFQPTQDQPYVAEMVKYLNTEHKYLSCSNKQLFFNLFPAVDARDLPCMADVESSLLYFCSEVSKECHVVMTGECADEIFGGYPWFHKQALIKKDNFPWSYDFSPRNAFLSDHAVRTLELEEFSRSAYEESLRQCPLSPDEDARTTRRRQIMFLNLRWFMATLLSRMDRCSMYYGLEARVPFADIRIVEYLWNVPWELKDYGGMEKGLLRQASLGLLPEEVLFRKKSPYPKTYHPAYETMLKNHFLSLLNQKNAPILDFVDRKKALQILNTPSDYKKPWYGQLMAGPQMIAYLLQVNYWMEKYQLSSPL